MQQNSPRLWSITKDTFDDYYKKGKIVFPDDYNFLNISIPAYRVFESEDKLKALKKYGSEIGIKAASTFLDKYVGMTQDGNKDMIDIFGKVLFSFPKPTSLITHFLKIINDKNAVVLDFFAGSGTTAHAAMDLNAKDGGNRKFICVQWAEETPEKSEARKAGYETIFDITKERIKRAGENILGSEALASPKSAGLKSHLRNSDNLFGGTEVPLPLDIGFRTFEVVEDAKQKIYQKSLEEVSQEDLVAMMEKPNISSNEEILYNLFVAEALPLSAKHQELIKDKFYLASNVAFILEDITSDELVEALKDKKECEYITVYSPNISNDKFTLEIESNISKLGIKPDKLRFRG